MSYNIYCEDCIEGAKKYIDDESVDLMVCDPPFGINETSFGKHYKRDEDVVIEGYVEAPADYDRFTFEWMEQAKRVLKPDGSFYIISGWTNLKDILNAGEALGLYLCNHIIWKYNFGVYTKKKFVTSHYHILYYLKSPKARPTFNQYCRFGPSARDGRGKSLNYQDMEDVWVINKEFKQGQKKNKNKLPDALLDKILLYSSNEKDTVCDFFQGNFTTAMSAIRLGRIPVGFELNEEAYNHNMPLLDDIKPGCDLSYVMDIFNDIQAGPPVNQGKKITPEERESILSDYEELSSTSMRKKDIIKTLGERYGRGKFSIINIVNK
jgi:site-specific DNA-methyltransferase (adenine-specific)